MRKPKRGTDEDLETPQQKEEEEIIIPKDADVVSIEQPALKIYLQSHNLGIVKLLELALITRDGILNPHEKEKRTNSYT